MVRIKKGYGWQIVLILLIGLELLIFGSINPRFVNIYNLLYSIGDFLYIAIAALPMTMIIVSGGISSDSDIRKLEKIGAWGVVLGRALYEGRINLRDFSNF